MLTSQFHKVKYIQGFFSFLLFPEPDLFCSVVNALQKLLGNVFRVSDARGHYGPGRSLRFS